MRAGGGQGLCRVVRCSDWPACAWDTPLGGSGVSAMKPSHWRSRWPHVPRPTRRTSTFGPSTDMTTSEASGTCGEALGRSVAGDPNRLFGNPRKMRPGLHGWFRWAGRARGDRVPRSPRAAAVFSRPGTSLANCGCPGRRRRRCPQARVRSRASGRGVGGRRRGRRRRWRRRSRRATAMRPCRIGC